MAENPMYSSSLQMSKVLMNKILYKVQEETNKLLM
jgi:hypothetical protein